MNDANGLAQTPRLPSSLGTEAERLLTASLAGDQQSLGELLSLYRPLLLTIAREHWKGCLRAKMDESDLVQDALVNGVQAFHDFRGQTEAELIAWLRQILIHRAHNARRRFHTQRRNVDREEELAECLPQVSSPTPSAICVAQEERKRLEAALSCLPADYVKVILLKQFGDLPWEEVGQQLDRSADAARKLWARAIVALQDQLKSQSHEGGA